MSDAKKPVGTVSWFDLTIDDAETVRAFYEQVVGWTSQPVSMGDYDDHCMQATDGEAVGGICHARGENAGLPPQWLPYVTVDNLDERLERCRSHGGKVVNGPREIGRARCAVIEDPAGAVIALYES